MAAFFRASTTWVIDFRHDGRPRRWFKVIRDGVDPMQAAREQLRSLYGGRARLEQVRRATADEELQYLRGDEPRNVFCPTGRPARRD